MSRLENGPPMTCDVRYRGLWLSNEILAASGVPFLSFAIPSTVSIIPWSTTTVYFGSLAKDIADIFDGQVPLKGTYSYIFYSLSGILMVLVVAYTTIISR